MAGLVRQNPSLINLFIPAHRCDYLISANRHRSNNVPVKNPLFDYEKVEANIHRISIVVDNEVDPESGSSRSILSQMIRFRNVVTDYPKMKNLLVTVMKMNDSSCWIQSLDTWRAQ